MGEGFYTILGAVIGAGISIIIFYFKNKSEERRFNTLLVHNDINKVKEKIFSMVNSLNKDVDIHNWSNQITDFISSYEASILPQELIEKIQKEVAGLIKNHKENFPDLYAFEEDQLEELQYDYEQMDFHDKRMFDLQNKIDKMKKRIIQKWLKIK